MAERLNPKLIRTRTHHRLAGTEKPKSEAVAERSSPPSAPMAERSPPPSTLIAASSLDDARAEADRDGKGITVSTGGATETKLHLTAAQADQLVRAIGAVRTDVQPSPPANWSYGQSVSTIYDPRWTTEAERRKGDTLLHIRDPRYGWLHYTIPRRTAQQLGGLLRKQASLPTAGRRADADTR